jgi:hypothetical protein
MVALREAKTAIVVKANMNMRTTTRATPACLGGTDENFAGWIMA